jgi:hypothetical protein
MKTLKYAVSVQWGEGHHYFVDTDITNTSDLDHAILRARVNTNIKYTKALRKNSRSPRPKIHTWEKLETIKP